MTCHKTTLAQETPSPLWTSAPGRRLQPQPAGNAQDLSLPAFEIRHLTMHEIGIQVSAECTRFVPRNRCFPAQQACPMTVDASSAAFSSNRHSGDYSKVTSDYLSTDRSDGNTCGRHYSSCIDYGAKEQQNDTSKWYSPSCIVSKVQDLESPLQRSISDPTTAADVARRIMLQLQRQGSQQGQGREPVTRKSSRNSFAVIFQAPFASEPSTVQGTFEDSTVAVTDGDTPPLMTCASSRRDSLSSIDRAFRISRTSV